MGVAKGGSRRCNPQSPLFLGGGGPDLDRGALAAEVGGLKLVGLFLTIAHHLSRHHLVKELLLLESRWKVVKNLTLVSTGVAVAPIASTVVAQLMGSPSAPVRGAMGGLLRMVGSQGVWAFIWPMVGGKASLVGRLMASPLRQRGTQDWLPLDN